MTRVRIVEAMIVLVLLALLAWVVLSVASAGQDELLDSPYLWGKVGKWDAPVPPVPPDTIVVLLRPGQVLIVRRDDR